MCRILVVQEIKLFISHYHRHKFYLSHPVEALPRSNIPRTVYRMRRMDLIETGTLRIFHSLLLRNYLGLQNGVRLRDVAGYRVDQLYKAVTVLTLTHSCVLALLLNSGPLN